MYFDTQASSFDHRAGLPDAAAEAVARTLAALHPEGHWLVEIGAGTGGIGRWIAGSAGRDAGRYVGFDLSLGMLARFRERSAAPLVQSDANAPWPLASGCAGLVFLSRAAHLLEQKSLLGEILRVAHPSGALLVLGRVRRSEASVRARLRQRVHQLLAERDLPRREGRGTERRILDEITALGGAAEEPRTAATWSVRERAADSLASWRSKPGLAGTSLPTPLRDEVLAELERWAVETLGSLSDEHPTIESYELLTARLPAATSQPFPEEERP